MRAARALDQRLSEGLEGLEAGIGVAAGAAGAENIGAARRYEYTVISDPVNQAARVTELAKDKRRRVLTSAAVVEEADEEEAGRCELGDELTLRGRASSTRLACPRSQ